MSYQARNGGGGGGGGGAEGFSSSQNSNSSSSYLAANAVANTESVAHNKSRTMLRSSLDVELTFPAFRLPGVYDRRFEANFLFANADTDNPRHFHRAFHHHTGFPPNRKYSLIGTAASPPGFAPERAGSFSVADSPGQLGNTLTPTTPGPGAFPLFRDEEGEPIIEMPRSMTDGEADMTLGLGAQREKSYPPLSASPSALAKPKRVGANMQLIPMGAIDTRSSQPDGHDNTDSYSLVRRIIFGNARRMNVSRLERKDINFSSIVDIDDEAFESYVTDDLAGRLGEGNFFRLFMLIVIILNSITIGIQTDSTMRYLYSPIFSHIDNIFLSIFIVEILFKWYYAFGAFWKSAWNWLDVALVIIALMGSLVTFGQSSRILKMLRMIRAFRSLRTISSLSGIYTVLQVVIRSIPDMLNITLLLLILMFIFAVVGVTLFSTTFPSQFADLGTAFFFLFILVCGDGWVGIFNQMEAAGQFTAGAIYCVLFITIGQFVFSNLVVAVVVNNLEETYDNIKKQMKAKFRKLRSRATNAGAKSESLRALASVPDSEEAVYLNQIPFELPQFDRITETRLENYYLLLMIIEDNLKEYVQIKEQLNEILGELKEINKNVQHDDGQEDALDNDDDDFVEELDTGDALTRLINMQTPRR
ncbi:Ion transport protein-domain-containing protein [Blastocladiella britannica]|nr:Ion transport protein-domain-containing protein [Blastocladiella britannica]